MSRSAPAINPSNDTDIMTTILRTIQRSFHWGNLPLPARSTNSGPHLPLDTGEKLLVVHGRGRLEIGRYRQIHPTPAACKIRQHGLLDRRPQGAGLDYQR